MKKLLFILPLCSCKVQEKPVTTVIYSVDSLENPEEHLYNEWE